MEVTLNIKDEVLLKVIRKMVGRSNEGIIKYGTTLKDDKNDSEYFLKQIQIELMDAVLYLQKAKETYSKDFINEAFKPFEEIKDDKEIL